MVFVFISVYQYPARFPYQMMSVSLTVKRRHISLVTTSLNFSIVVCGYILAFILPVLRLMVLDYRFGIFKLYLQNQNTIFSR